MKILLLPSVALSSLVASASPQDCTGWFDADPTPDMGPRAGHAMAYDSMRERTVLAGGTNGANKPYDTWEWDGQSWTQIESDVGPGGRVDLAMTYDSKRGVVIAGGGFDYNYPLSSVYEFNGSQWTSAPELPTGLTDLAMAFDSNRGVTVLFGGLSYNNKLQKKTYEYDGQQWTSRSDQGPPARRDHCMAYDEVRGVVVLHGGWTPAYDGRDTWEWDGTSWALRGIDGPGFEFACMTYDTVAHRVILFGAPNASYVWAWDGAKWTAMESPGLKGRSNAAMAFDAAREQAVLVGGQDDEGIPNDTWGWDGSQWSLLHSHYFNGRSGASMVYHDQLQRCVLFGGGGSGSGYGADQTWSWDGNGWSLLNDSEYAPQSGGCRMSYDSDRDALVALGGELCGNSYCETLGDTHEYRGGVWTYVVQGPSLQAHAMAYDRARGVTLVFGGYYSYWDHDIDTFQLKGDTWTWDGSQWNLAAIDGPQPRADHVMAYDPDRAVIVLHGGAVVGDVLNDTWEWDGASWSLVSTDGPICSRAAMAYDNERHVTVLYGGRDEYPSQETWEWDGTTWTLRVDLGDAGPRYGHVMAYDSARSTLVVHGGHGWGQDTLIRSTYELQCASSCEADLNGDGDLDLFDFLAFVNAFNTADPKADCDHSGSLDLFDFLCFTNAFNAGC